MKNPSHKLYFDYWLAAKLLEGVLTFLVACNLVVYDMEERTYEWHVNRMFVWIPMSSRWRYGYDTDLMHGGIQNDIVYMCDVYKHYKQCGINQKCELTNGHREFILTFSNGQLFLLKPNICGLQNVANVKYIWQKALKMLCADMLLVTVITHSQLHFNGWR